MSFSSATLSSMLYDNDDEENSLSDEDSWHSCDTDNEYENLSDLHFKLLEQVKQSVKMVSTLDKQIAAFDDQKGGFEHWYNDEFKMALKEMRHRVRQEKNLDAAYELKKMAEAYFEWKETEKAFDYINRTIKAIPREEKSFLGNCFALRAEMHMQLNFDASLALSDLEKALLCRPHSYSCITRKIDILEKMKQKEEAFSFIDGILMQANLLKKFSTKQICRLRQLHADLRQYEPKPVDSVNEKLKVSTAVLGADKRLKMLQNGNHKRYGLFAVENIASRSTVLTERPALFALKADGRNQLCNNCWIPCKNTFWPCANCTEVIYCSQKCSTEDKAKSHYAECGFLDLLTIDSPSNVHSLMVLRFLLQHGHEKLMAKMVDSIGITTEGTNNVKQEEKDGENFKLDECFNGLIISGSVDTTSSDQLSAWFFVQQSALMRTFNEEKKLYSKRNAHQIVQSVYILSLYLHYRKLKPSSLGKTTIHGLLRLLSIQLYAVALNEYSWTNKGSGERNKTSNSSFQCLFASSIGHSCKANAEWQFTVDGSFTLRTTAHVEAGDELTISYGVNATETPCLYTRLATLSRFGRLCACASCLADANEVFALQCLYCQGPVPWNSTLFPNDMCIVCEHKYDGIEVAKTIEQEMKATKQIVNLLSVVNVFKGSNSINSYLEQSEAKLALISKHIYPHNRSFQSAVLDLCENYMEKDMNSQTVTWFQWFAVKKGIFLTCAHEANYSTTDKKKKKDEIKADSLLTRFHFYEKWTNAYLCFIEQQKTSTNDDSLMSHMKVANKLLSQMNDVIVIWSSMPPSSSSLFTSTFLSSIGSDMQQMCNHLWTLFGKHSRRYMTLLNPFMESAVSQMSNSPLMNTASLTYSSFQLEQLLPPTGAVLQNGINDASNDK